MKPLPVVVAEWLIRKVGWGWTLSISALVGLTLALISVFAFEGVIAVVLFAIGFAGAVFFAMLSYMYHKIGIWDDHDPDPEGKS